MDCTAEPIRQEILETLEPGFPATSDLATTPYDQQGLSKLKILITLICQNQPEYGNISLSYQTICGLMVSNTKRFTRPSRIIADKMDNSHGRTKDKAGFVSSQLTIKLYSTIRSKNLIQSLFHLGITLSYWSTLQFVEELAVTVKDLYCRSGNRVLPGALQKDLFTVVVDDNIDKNSSSSSATCHLYGTSVTILQFPTVDNSGEHRQRRRYCDMTAEEVDQMKSSGTCPEQSYLHVSIADLPKHVQCPKQVVHKFKEEFEREMQKLFEEQHNEEDGWLMSAVTAMERMEFLPHLLGTMRANKTTSVSKR